MSSTLAYLEEAERRGARGTSTVNRRTPFECRCEICTYHNQKHDLAEGAE